MGEETFCGKLQDRNNVTFKFIAAAEFNTELINSKLIINKLIQNMMGKTYGEIGIVRHGVQNALTRNGTLEGSEKREGREDGGTFF